MLLCEHKAFFCWLLWCFNCAQFLMTELYCKWALYMQGFVWTSVSYLSFYFFAKHHDQNQLGKERIYLAYMPWSQHIMGSQATNTRKGRVGVEIMKEHCLLAYSSWLAYLFSRYHLSKMALPVGLALPHYSSIKKNAHRLTHSPVWWR